MTTVITRTDSEFSQEIIDLIDGTHWTQGSLETTCRVDLFPGEQAPEGAETGEVFLTHYKAYRMEWRRNYQEWLNTPPSQRTTNPPTKEEHGAEDIIVDEDDIGGYGSKYSEPKLIGVYYKAQWCLVGMVLKVAALPTSSESSLYRNHDDESLRNGRHMQPWRIIDQIAHQIRVSKDLPDVDDDSASVTITNVEGWNDDDNRTKEEVREIMVEVRDHFKRGEEI